MERRRVKVVAAVIGSITALSVFLAIGGGTFISDLARIATAQDCGFPTTSAPVAHYDEQLYLDLETNYGNVTFDVQAVAQTDSDGYGPGYLLNGLSSAFYWYQVGIVYNWPCGDGYVAGFHFFTEVWNPNGDSVSGPSFLALNVSEGDLVNLSLGFNGSNVVMSAEDLTDGSSQSTTYPAEGSSSFFGGWSVDPQEPGYLTGVMTEWYHVHPYYGGEDPVTYEAITPLTGGGTDWITLGVGEKAVPGGLVFGQIDVVTFRCACVYPFSYEGAKERVGPTSFETGG